MAVGFVLLVHCDVDASMVDGVAFGGILQLVGQDVDSGPRDGRAAE